jgi:hypothetical protein
MLAKVLGTPLPDILYDGIIDPKKQSSGKLPDSQALRIRNNGNAGFANFDALALKGLDKPGAKAPNIIRDLASYDGTHPALDPVALERLK